jgi:hypothetical protein
MKRTMMKLVYFALALTFLAAVPALAATPNTATIDMPSSQWETTFLTILASLEIEKPENPAFTVKEFPTQSGLPGFEHTLAINKCLSVAYYDHEDKKFNSAILTIKLDEVGGVVDPAWLTVIATTLAGQPNVKAEQVVELVNTVCPPFNNVLLGKEAFNGSQTGTLYGVGYAIELNDKERFIRFYTNVQLSQN